MSEIAAIDWIGEHMRANISELSTLGFRWLRNARLHLEDRVEAELRQTK